MLRLHKGCDELRQDGWQHRVLNFHISFFWAVTQKLVDPPKNWWESTEKNENIFPNLVVSNWSPGGTGRTSWRKLNASRTCAVWWRARPWRCRNIPLSGFIVAEVWKEWKLNLFLVKRADLYYIDIHIYIYIMYTVYEYYVNMYVRMKYIIDMSIPATQNWR